MFSSIKSIFYIYYYTSLFYTIFPIFLQIFFDKFRQPIYFYILLLFSVSKIYHKISYQILAHPTNNSFMFSLKPYHTFLCHTNKFIDSVKLIFPILCHIPTPDKNLPKICQKIPILFRRPGVGSARKRGSNNNASFFMQKKQKDMYKILADGYTVNKIKNSTTEYMQNRQ